MNEIPKIEKVENNLTESKLLEKTENKMSIQELDNYWNKKFELNKNEINETGLPEKFYSKKEDREMYLPQEGKWEGEVGDSKFILDNKEVNQELKKYHLDGIEYKNCVPDFSKCSEVTTKIDKITPDLVTNFKEFSKKLVAEGKFASEREVLEFKQKNNLQFHECSDMKTCQLVPISIHEAFKHTGGRFEAREYEKVHGKKGVKFDE